MSRVGHAVRNLREFLEANGEVGWAENLRGIEGELAATESRGQALAKLRDCFGGMGSRNNIWVATDGGIGNRPNRRLARLLDTCYREAVLADEHRWGRILWFAFSIGNIGGVPPRIRRAFT
jgi:hypothetical protein